MLFCISFAGEAGGVSQTSHWLRLVVQAGAAAHRPVPSALSKHPSCFSCCVPHIGVYILIRGQRRHSKQPGAWRTLETKAEYQMPLSGHKMCTCPTKHSECHCSLHLCTRISLAAGTSEAAKRGAAHLLVLQVRSDF